MPELPEVQTTVNGLSKTVVGKSILDIWSDFHVKTTHGNRKNIKNKKYFKVFKKATMGAKITEVERKGKHIVINLSNKNSIVVHMKMTGHLMYGKYEKNRENTGLWTPVEKGPLKDPFNKFIHLVISLSDKKHLVLSDMRKFASVCISKTEELNNHPGIFTLGPDPMQKMKVREFVFRIKSKKTWPIKSTLMNQTVIAGIGNIYSDEILWETSVNPMSESDKIPDKILDQMFLNAKKILRKSISLGGDSMSDYRNVFGQKGGFQKLHKAYRKTGYKCVKNNCRGIIKRTVIKGRSSHFCPVHQLIYP